RPDRLCSEAAHDPQRKDAHQPTVEARCRQSRLTGNTVALWSRRACVLLQSPISRSERGGEPAVTTRQGASRWARDRASSARDPPRDRNRASRARGWNKPVDLVEAVRSAVVFETMFESALVRAGDAESTRCFSPQSSC